MTGGFFFTVFYQPIYNLLVLFIGLVPNYSIGIAVVLTTVLVKTILYPLTKKALLTQIKMKELEPKIKLAKEKHKGHREAEAKALMEIYKEAKLNPFAGFFAILVQLPVIFALFFIFSKAGLPGELPLIKTDILYSFISAPTTAASMVFLGIFNMAQKSWILAVLAGVTQFIQAQLASPQLPPKGDSPNFQEDFARSMQIQIKFVLPVIIIFVAHGLASAVALYFVVSNIFSIGQELLLRRHKNNASVAI